MFRLLKDPIYCWIIISSTAFPSRAQPPLENVQAADTNAAVANPAPVDEAPDLVIKKLFALVREEKYAEAQQLAVGLVLAYPNDQRLVKAKVMMDQALVSAKPADTTPDVQSAVSVAQTAASESPAPLTGMDKIDYSALVQRAREAQQMTDLARQKTLLKQFMGDSRQFLQKHPDQILLWQIRAAAALSLDDTMAGFEAGQKLLAAGAAGSSDPDLQHLLVQLKLKDWLDEQTVKEALAPLNYTSGQNHTTTLPNAVPLDLVWITPGTFTMGSPNAEFDRRDDEWPQTTVTISKGFWLGKMPVTQGQYQAVTGDNPSNFAIVGTDAPVEQVSWDDAMEFCRKLTEQERAAGRLPEGYAFTLPTEAQWEYACRAGMTGARCGNLNDIAWYGSNSNGSTHPVGQKKPNAFRLYDMFGNVWEWCSDWFGDYPGGNVVDPVGPGSGTRRVIRGGGSFSAADYFRFARRDGVDSRDRDAYLGFRLALAPSR